MATTRPLMRLSIGDLEDIFEKQIKNSATLGRLRDELCHRQVPRALALLERVQQAEALLKNEENNRPAPKSHGATLQLKPRTSYPAQVSPPSIEETNINPPFAGLGQPDLFVGSAPSQEPISPEAAATFTSVNVASPRQHVATEPEALPQLSLEDACRFLKVGMGDSWEKIETARRKIVLKSNPLATAALPQAQLQKLLADTKLANDAAIVIAARRSGRQ